MQLITSAQNPTVKHAHALLTQHRARKKSGETVLEGVHLLQAYLDKDLPIKTMLVGEADATHPEVLALLARVPERSVLMISDKLYKEIRTLGDSVAVMALIDVPKPVLADISNDCLILDGVQDAGNAGTLLRSAASVGIKTVISTEGSAHLWSPKCLRAGMGAQFSMTIYEQMAAEDVLRCVKVPLYATSSHTDKWIYEHSLTAPMAWVLGHEGQGVSDIFLSQATPIALPQPGGQESLNVGVAGSVCFYEMLRQRQFAG